MEPKTSSQISSSPFFEAGPTTRATALALLPHRRDLIQPTILSADRDAVCNTRFGNYPHSTLLGIPWGSQVLASKLVQDNQRRKNKKRKAEELVEDDFDDGLVILSTASSGFTHVLPPTPELWTQSLPHRTQVVYTPDYSYVLHRLRVRPGSVIIEAGAGSGSFTHAAARAVYNQYGSEKPFRSDLSPEERKLHPKTTKSGKVFSFEYHEPRAKQLFEEIKSHGLDNIVTVTHRDVYEDGFCPVQPTSSNESQGDDGVQATAVFLDLPAPWLALKHLHRGSSASSNGANDLTAAQDHDPCTSSSSPLSRSATVHLCTFSPCIEQVSKTVSVLRELGWIDVDMVEMAQRRLDIRRARYGAVEEDSRNHHPVPTTADQAVERLREMKATEEKHRAAMKEREAQIEKELGMSRDEAKDHVAKVLKSESKLAMAAKADPTVKNHISDDSQSTKQGRKFLGENSVVMRTEPEMKCHTSYLVFATLPRAWNEQDELSAAQRVRAIKSSKG